MAKRKKEAEPVETPAKPIQELPTLPGETYGLAISSPPETSANEPASEPDNEPDIDVGGEATERELQVSDAISSDPSATVAAALLATGRLYNAAGEVSSALSKHLRSTAGQPELHAFMMRMQTLLGEFRHSFEQIDSGMSDMLRDAIQDAMAA